MRTNLAITALVLLTATPSESKAAAVELSTTITETVAQKVVAAPPIHTGETIHYLVTARNGGNAGINVPLDLYFPQQILPSNGTGTGFSCSLTGRTTLHCITTSLLLANSSRNLSVTAEAPLAITGDSQTFTIRAKIDPANAVPEGNEVDNESTVQTTVVPRGPDLTVDLSGSDRTATGAGEVKYLVQVKNIGDRAITRIPVLALEFPTVVQFSRIESAQAIGGCNSIGSAVQCPLGTALATGASASATFVGKVSPTVQNNSVASFGAQIDPQNLVAELDRTNNSANVKTTMTELADLVVAAQTHSSFSCELNPFPFLRSDVLHDVLRAKVRNTGGTNSAATKVRVTISGDGAVVDWGAQKLRVDCDTVISSNCTAKSGSQAVCDIGPLAPGGSQDLALNAAHNKSKSYQVEFKVDPDDDVAESAESNNAASQTIQ